MYGDHFGEFVCGYWDLKGERGYFLPRKKMQNALFSGNKY